MKLNWLCQMATYEDKRLDAAKLFDRIGKNWDEETWTYWYLFGVHRGIAQTVRDLDGPKSAGMPGFKEYNDSAADLFRQNYSKALKQCTVGAGNSVPPSFNVYVRIEADGGATDSVFLNDHDIPHCLNTALENARFPPPPEDFLGPDRTSVWVRIPIRPHQPDKPNPLTSESRR